MNGEFFCEEVTIERGPGWCCLDQCTACRLEVAAANIDDTPLEWPEELRVQEFPRELQVREYPAA